MIKFKDKYGPKLHRPLTSEQREWRAEKIYWPTSKDSIWWVDEANEPAPPSSANFLVKSLLIRHEAVRGADAALHRLAVQRDELIKTYGGQAW